MGSTVILPCANALIVLQTRELFPLAMTALKIGKKQKLQRGLSMRGTGGAMMPNRIIKESICTSDSIEALSDFHEAFFYRLIVNCDDYGRMDARPAILKARLYPLRDKVSAKDIQNALKALERVGCIELYYVFGKPYLRLPSWESHQQIRAKKSKYPEPDFSCNQLISDDCKCARNPIQSESESESESELSTHTTHGWRVSTDFDRFWQAYPRKVGKQAALKAFKKVNVPVETLVEAVEKQKKSAQWKKDNGQYIPNPATWLNQGRWEDETEPDRDYDPYHYDPGSLEGSL